MDLEEIKDNFEKSFDLFMKECKHVSLCGFVVLGYFYAKENGTNQVTAPWYLILALIFAIALLFNLLTYHAKACRWYNKYKEQLTPEPKKDTTNQDSPIKLVWRYAAIAFSLNLLGFVFLAIGFATKAILLISA